MRDLNPRHPRCKRGALAAELIARLAEVFAQTGLRGEAADSVKHVGNRKGEVFDTAYGRCAI
jgi:hypothetical protein